MIKPLEVTVLPGYKLRLRYADAEGEVDLSYLVGQGVFALWNDAQEFAKAHIGEGNEIRWTDEVDLCSDALYLQITGKTVEDVFPLATDAKANA